MTDLTDLTLAAARDALARKELTSVELTRAHIDAMAKARALNAYIVETADKALAMAAAEAHAKIAFHLPQ